MAVLHMNMVDYKTLTALVEIVKYIAAVRMPGRAVRLCEAKDLREYTSNPIPAVLQKSRLGCKVMRDERCQRAHPTADSSRVSNPA